MINKIIILVALLSMQSMAAGHHYGMAGCGLGSLVFQDQPGKIQIVAATVNDLVSPQTSAITTGTSGCYEESRDEVSMRYIENNKSALKEDVARGQGETIEGLMTLWSCDSHSQVTQDLKKNYNSIFKTNETTQILNDLKSNSEIQKSCNSLT